MSLGFGHVARVGHLYPSGGLCDYEVQLMAPDGVQFVTTRLPFRRTGVDDDVALLANIGAECRLLADAEVDLIAMNCTAASMIVGPAEVNERIFRAVGIRSVTTAEAVIAALHAAGISHPTLLTPYPDEVVEAERAFLAQHGVDVAQPIGRPCDTPVNQASIPELDWYHMALEADHAAADGLLISCAGIQIAGVLSRIERELGLPVVASNQALLWHVLRTLGVDERPRGYGALLSGVYDG
jgi:maleate isomerase